LRGQNPGVQFDHWTDRPTDKHQGRGAAWASAISLQVILPRQENCLLQLAAAKVLTVKL